MEILKKQILTIAGFTTIMISCSKHESQVQPIKAFETTVIKSNAYNDAMLYNRIMYNSALKNDIPSNPNARESAALSAKIEDELIDSISILKGSEFREMYIAYKNSDEAASSIRNQDILVSKLMKSAANGKMEASDNVLTEINTVTKQLVDSVAANSVHANYINTLNNQLTEITIRHAKDSSGVDIIKYTNEVSLAVSVIINDVNNNKDLTAIQKEGISNICYSALASVVSSSNLSANMTNGNLRIEGFWNVFTKIIATVAAVVITAGSIAGGALFGGPIGASIGAVVGFNLGNNMGRQIYCSQTNQVPKCKACNNTMGNTIGGLILIWAKC